MKNHVRVCLYSSVFAFILAAFSGCNKSTDFCTAMLTETGFTECLSGEYGYTEKELRNSMTGEQKSRLEKEPYLYAVFEQEGNPLDQYIYISNISSITFSDIEGNWNSSWILSPDGIFCASSYTLVNADSAIFYRILSAIYEVCPESSIGTKDVLVDYVDYDPVDQGNVYILWKSEDGTYAYLSYSDSAYTGKNLYVETGIIDLMAEAVQMYSEST